MFDDLFCQFPTFGRDFVEDLAKWLPLSAEDRFEKKIFFRTKKCSSKEIRI